MLLDFPGVDSVVPPACFARNRLCAPGIIKAALGFLARLGGLIAVLTTIASIAAEPARAEASLNEAHSDHSVADAQPGA